MLDVLLTILSLLAALSLLVAVHELGHYLVARWSGVKVLRFSIGFGKPLWQRRHGPDQTEYTIAAIPLGGYVKMLDEREGEVDETELHRAFNRQPLTKRTAIVIAGPLFNFIFAILAYWLMFIVGVDGIKPQLGEIESGTIAYEAGLRQGQLVLAVDDERTPTWQSVIEAVMPRMLLGHSLTVTVDDGGVELNKRLDFSAVDPRSKPQQLFAQLGLKPHQPPLDPVIEQVVADSAAERGGLQAGDRVVRVNGEAVAHWQEMVGIIAAHPDRLLSMQVLRDGRELALELRPEAVDGDNGPVGRIGAVVRVDPAVVESQRATLQYGPAGAVTEAVAKTWEMSALTLTMIGEMIVGRASVENLSGPIGIAQYAKQSASAGVSQFLKFLGLISVSLGVLNLLPIPVLDGGHLLYYAVEAVKGSPVSEQVEAMGQRVGLAIILALMSVAIFNDLTRLT
ncbi:MAG: RIP metalloprotease RseP, partial [Pseudomonadota bacterium]